MAKKLVAYFSAGGTTKKIAEQIAEAGNADLCEITPKVAYTTADLNWMDKKSRSSVEMNDKKFRPEIVKADISTLLLDFLSIVNTFLESYDFTGKKIVLFATSGGSGFGNTVKELKPSAPGAEIVEGKLLNRASRQEIADWVKSL